MKFMTGERKWNKDNFPGIEMQVEAGILSHIRNEYKKSKSGRQIKYTQYPDEEIKADDEYPGQFMDEDIGDKDIRTNVEEVIKKCRDKIEEADDAEAFFVFNEMLNGTKSNIKIAENLALNVRDVENAKKRIRRMVNNVWLRNKKE